MATLEIISSGSGITDSARLQNTAAAANNNGSDLAFAANRTTSGLTNVASVAGLITDVTDSAFKGALAFSTANIGTPSERMRIDSNGNVGIGTTAPDAKLDVVGSVNDHVVVEVTNQSSGTDAWSGLVVGNDVGALGFVSISSSTAAESLRSRIGVSSAAVSIISYDTDVRIYTGGDEPSDERLRVTNTGSVGIGTMSPSNLLTCSTTSGGTTNVVNIETTVAGSNFYSPQVIFTAPNRDGTTGQIGGGNYAAGRIGLTLTGGSGSTPHVAIDSNGKMGIGTTAPDSRLDIGDGALTIQEMTAPSAPASNKCVMYAEDNGAGKTRLMVKFATGAPQQIAIEP